MRDAVRPPSQGLTHAGMTTFAALDSRLRNSEIPRCAEAGCMLHAASCISGRQGGVSRATGPKPPSPQATPALQCRHARLPSVSAQSPVLGTQSIHL
jgi:hypothetical protein